jgi:hypothetical protein
MAAGDWPRAFSIASKFARLGPQWAAILRAQAAPLSPGLYRQLGRDPAAIIEEGKAAMRERFGARSVAAGAGWAGHRASDALTKLQTGVCRRVYPHGNLRRPSRVLDEVGVFAS